MTNSLKEKQRSDWVLEDVKYGGGSTMLRACLYSKGSGCLAKSLWYHNHICISL